MLISELVDQEQQQMPDPQFFIQDSEYKKHFDRYKDIIKSSRNAVKTQAEGDLLMKRGSLKTMLKPKYETSVKANRSDDWNDFKHSQKFKVLFELGKSRSYLATYKLLTEKEQKEIALSQLNRLARANEGTNDFDNTFVEEANDDSYGEEMDAMHHSGEARNLEVTNLLKTQMK